MSIILKNKSLSAIWFLVLMLAFAGCSDDDPADPTNTDPTQGAITATIDGTVVDYSRDSGAILTGNGYACSGSDADEQSDALLDLPFATGDVDLSGISYSIILGRNGVVYMEESAVCNISTATAERLVGTFSGTFKDVMSADTVTVTDGMFDIPVTDNR